jgi:nucleotide-binding universal stress UspA family protein
VFEVVVVGTDGSESAGVAVCEATALAVLTNATLHVVSAYRPVSVTSVAMAATAGAATVDVEAVNRGAAAEAAAKA